MTMHVWVVRVGYLDDDHRRTMRIVAPDSFHDAVLAARDKMMMNYPNKPGSPGAWHPDWHITGLTRGEALTDDEPAI